MTRFRGAWYAAGTTALLALLTACSGPSPTQPPPPPPATVATPLAPGPSPSSSPAAASCPAEAGDIDSTCSRPGETYFQDVDAAIDRLVQQRPDIFEVRDAPSPGAYRVLKVDDYFLGVVHNLEQAGFCAARLGNDLQVKKSSAYSEEYDILLSSSHIHRGLRSYTQTCTPAIFPLDAEEVIVRVPIFLWGYHECPDPEREMPDFGLRTIPLGCTGLVTATPKDKNNHDVDARIHGPDITWTFPEGSDRIEVQDFPGVAFNKKLKTVRLGPFQVCATVKSKEGCYNFRVIP